MAKGFETPGGGEEKDIELESPQESLKRLQKEADGLGEEKDIELESSNESLNKLQKEANEENLIDLGEYHGMGKAEKKKRGLAAMKETPETVEMEAELPPESEWLKSKPGEKVIAEAPEEPEGPVYELTKEKNNFDPEKMSLDELDDRVQELWGAMGKIIEDAGAWKPSKEEKTKLKKFTKKGGEWPLDDAVTAENFKERLEKYGIAGYIDSSLIEKNRDPYAVVSKQYGIYRDALEKRIRKAKLKQLEEAEGKPKTKEEKAERQEEVAAEIKKELPPEATEKTAQEQVEEARKDLEKFPEEGVDIDVGEFEMPEKKEEASKETLIISKKEKEKLAKRTKKELKRQKKSQAEKAAKTGAGKDKLGLAGVLREKEREDARGVGKAPKKTETKKGLLARLFGGK